MVRRKRHEIDTTMLAEIGRLAPPDRQDDLRRTAERHGLYAAVVDEASGRCFPADAEDLAEGGAAEFLKEIAGPLKELGAGFDSVEGGDFDEETGQTVIVDSVTETIFTAEEADHDELWELATIRTFELVNRRLVAAGSPERLYALNGGNDLLAVFLTDRLAEMLGDKADRDEDRPYRPTEDDGTLL